MRVIGDSNDFMRTSHRYQSGALSSSSKVLIPYSENVLSTWLTTLALMLGGTLAALNAVCKASTSFFIRVPAIVLVGEEGGLNSSLYDDRRPLLINVMML